MRIIHFDKFFKKKFTFCKRLFGCNLLRTNELQHPTRTGVYACVRPSTYARVRSWTRSSTPARIIYYNILYIVYTILTCSVSILYRVITHTKPIISFHYVTRNCK